MARINSNTSGNFSNAAIWVGGVAPTNNDNFVIANTHLVTYDVTTAQTWGFDDSDIYGTLRHQAGANTILRMAGRLRIRTNGCYYMCDGANLQFRGTATESHIVYLVNEANASWIADGSDGMPSTTLSQTYAHGNTFIQVANAASFRPGEWIAVLNNKHQISNAQAGNPETLRDEGFWIHDVQANTLYLRQYVGPENSTVTSYTNNVLTVANSKVWRVGQEIMFGTGANLNIKKITAINYTANTITTNGPNLANDSVYRAGAWFNPHGANATFTTGIDAPDGSTDAVRWTQSNTGTVILRVNIPAFTPNGTDAYTLSFWARFISGTQTGLICDLADGAPSGTYNSLVTANQWNRIVFTGTPTATSKSWIDIISDVTTNNVIDFWGLQLEQSNTATEYIPTNGTVRSIRGTVTENTIYETGSDKIHGAGDKVRKIATLTTVASNSAQTTITVANVSSFLTNDEIWIEARSECGNTTDRIYNAYPKDQPFVHRVSSISANTITLATAVGYNVVTGALVTRMTRNIVIQPVTPNTDYYGAYTESYTTTYNRSIILKDIQLRYLGSSFGPAESGLYLNNGFSSSNNITARYGVSLVNQVGSSDVAPWIEGVAMTASNSTRDLGGFFNYVENAQIRCSTVVGIFNSSFAPWYRAGTAVYNCIAAGSSVHGFRAEYFGAYGEFAYNYSSRNDKGFRMIQYDGNMGSHHFIVDAYNNEAVFSTTSGGPPFYKWRITGGTYGLNSERGRPVLYYSQYKRCSGFGSTYAEPPVTYQRGWFHTQIDRGANPDGQLVDIVEDDFEIDKHRQFAYLVERYWNADENAWRVIHIVDAEDSGAGFFTTVYVPARSTLYASCQIKLAPNFGTNYPIFEARSVQSAIATNRVGNANTGSDGLFRGWFAGGSSSNTYTIAAATQYEERRVTVRPEDFPRHMMVGVYFNNRNQSRGFWMRDVNVFLDTPYVLPTYKFAMVSSGTGNFGVQGNFDARKMRLGGGRIKGY